MPVPIPITRLDQVFCILLGNLDFELLHDISELACINSLALELIEHLVGFVQFWVYLLLENYLAHHDHKFFKVDLTRLVLIIFED